jgi:hypothetical protein
MKRKHFLQFEISIGTFIATTGLVVMWGWVLALPVIVQIFPIFSPMQFNTALAFFMAGVSILFLHYERKKMASVFAFFAFGIGFLTFIEYLIGRDLHIDQLLMTSFMPTLY